MNEELYHYGVKGMKWGQRKDRKTGRILTRHVAAAKRNLRETASENDESEQNYRNSMRSYRQTRSSFSLSRSKKQARINEAESELNKASARAEISRSKLIRAEGIYKDTVDKLAKHLNDMSEKYGEENVKQISEKTYKLGQSWTEKLVKTGITVADLPIIGTAYTGNFIGEIEERQREQLLEERAKNRASSMYR